MSPDAPSSEMFQLAMGDCSPEHVSWEARIARAEDRLSDLQSLARIGLELTRDLARGCTEDTPGQVKTGRALVDSANAFVRLSRAVRLTLALESGIEAEIAALRAGTEPSGPASFGGSPSAPPLIGEGATDLAPLPSAGLSAAGAAPPAAEAQARAEDRDEGLDEDLRDSEPTPSGEGDLSSRLIQSLSGPFRERLRDVERPESFYDRPFEDAVRDIRRDLGLPPLAAGPGEDLDGLENPSEAAPFPGEASPGAASPQGGPWPPPSWRGGRLSRAAQRRPRPPERPPP